MPIQKKDESGKKLPNLKPKRIKKVATKQSDSKFRISKIQDLQLQVIAHTTHNNLDGKKIDKLLRKNRQLWRAAMVTGNNLWPLRDMEVDIWLADTLYILAREGYEHQLEELVRNRFDADELNWIGGKDAIETLGYWTKGIEDNPKLVLSIWWD